MNYFKGEKEFFPGIGKIEFEGRESKNPMAFHYYDENKVVMGKTLKDHLRFAMAYWHTLCAEGADQFGGGTKTFPWNAGVSGLIHFQERPVKELSHPKKYGFIITNPPYGERLEDKETLPAIYSEFGRQFAALDSWSAFMITSYTEAERYFGRKADANRKIYNGMLKTYYYQFLGPKPPRQGKQEKN